MNRNSLRFPATLAGLALAGALGLAAVSGAGCGAAASGPAQPNIVLITIDTLRADRLSSYGYHRPTTPAIDRLAEESVLFENVYAPMSTTLPVHVSLMTSTHPMRHGIEGNFEHFGKSFVASNDLTTLSRMLKRLGYVTGGFVSATPVKAHSGLAEGFDVWWEPNWEETDGENTVEQAVEWLESRTQGPFFLWLHLYDPHEPYDPPPPYDKFFNTDREGLQWLLDRGYADVRRGILRINDLYDGEVRYMDAQVERLVDALKSLDVYDEAAIVFTSDHGEGLGQHNWLNHGRIYQEQIRIPLIMKFPASLGVEPARRDDLATIMDVLPTLANAVGLDLTDDERAQFEGLDLFDGSSSRETVLAQRVDRNRQWEPGRKFALTSREWKYFLLTEGDDQLFHLAEDPHETANVIAEHPDVAEKMKGELLREMAKYDQYAAQREESTEIPEEAAKELEALGYVQ